MIYLSNQNIWAVEDSARNLLLLPLKAQEKGRTNREKKEIKSNRDTEREREREVNAKSMKDNRRKRGRSNYERWNLVRSSRNSALWIIGRASICLFFSLKSKQLIGPLSFICQKLDCSETRRLVIGLPRLQLQSWQWLSVEYESIVDSR